MRPRHSHVVPMIETTLTSRVQQHEAYLVRFVAKKVDVGAKSTTIFLHFHRIDLPATTSPSSSKPFSLQNVVEKLVEDCLYLVERCSAGIEQNIMREGELLIDPRDNIHG